jgi:DNA-binding transcriptional LysR family regulator
MKLTDIDTNLLLALDALLTERSVTRAAARLGVGQPAMSHSLARLREHFGDPLLVRRGRDLALSDRARGLLDAVTQATAALSRVFEERPGFDPAAPRTFAVSCTDLFSLRFVPELLRVLGRDAPGVDVEVRPLVARSTERILGDGVDLAFGVFEDVPPAINQEYLFSDPLVCVVRDDHPAVGATLSLETYLSLPHLEVAPAPQSRPGARIDRVLAAQGHRRKVKSRVPYFMLAARILARTDQVLTMTRSYAWVLGTLAPLRIVAPPIDVPPLAFSQIWLHRHDDDPGHRWLRALTAGLCRDAAGPTTP